MSRPEGQTTSPMKMDGLESDQINQGLICFQPVSKFLKLNCIT